MYARGGGWGGWLAALLLALACAAPALAEEGEPGLLERTGTLLERTFKSVASAVEATPGEEDAPQRIAVLPATGQGSAGQLEDVRIAIHNGLSSKNFELQRPQEVDQTLAAAGLDAAALAGVDPAEVARRLQTEGLVYVDVLGIDKVYAGAYAHQEVSVRLRLFSAARNAFIWEKTETQTEREGGLSLSLFGILTTIVTSTRVLTDGVRQALVDRLARTFASNIPQPKSVRTQGQPPAIQVAFTNWGDGPFRAGDEVIVYMKGEPGLSATFDLGREHAGLRLNEKAPGDYLGSYVVRAGDDAENLQVSLRATRLNPRASIDWRVPGRIGLDSTPPGGVTGFRAVPVQAGVRLSWQPPAAGGADLLYVVERTDSEGGRYSPLAEVATGEYVDRTVAPGGDYHYRLTPRDAARNTGPQSVARVTGVAPGPTDLTGEIAEDRTLYAVGSPYRVQGTLRVRPTAKLLLEPGSVVEFAPGAVLEVLGGIRSQGTAEAPVSFSGRDWRLVLRDTGERDNRFQHTRFEGEGAEIGLSGSHATFEQCIWRGMAKALKADDRSVVQIAQGQFSQNAVAVQLANTRAGLRQTEFRANDRALVVGEGVGFDAAGLGFDGNRRHVETVRELNLGAARFRDASFADMQARIDGPVRIDWQSLSAEVSTQSRNVPLSAQ